MRSDDMGQVLLCSESFVKSVTAISDNISGKYIQPSLREAQENGLRGILGDALTDRLKGMVADGSIRDADNAAYMDLLDRCQYYLAYSAVVEIVQKVSLKVTGFGLAKATDEHLESSSQDDRAKAEWYYQGKADACCVTLQQWLLDNRDAFPELDDCSCRAIRANLRSAASCGIWLGGVRGRMTVGKCGR